MFDLIWEYHELGLKSKKMRKFGLRVKCGTTVKYSDSAPATAALSVGNLLKVQVPVGGIVKQCKVINLDAKGRPIALENITVPLGLPGEFPMTGLVAAPDHRVVRFLKSAPGGAAAQLFLRGILTTAEVATWDATGVPPVRFAPAPGTQQSAANSLGYKIFAAMVAAACPVYLPTRYKKSGEAVERLVTSISFDSIAKNDSTRATTSADTDEVSSVQKRINAQGAAAERANYKNENGVLPPANVAAIAAAKAAAAVILADLPDTLRVRIKMPDILI